MHSSEETVSTEHNGLSSLGSNDQIICKLPRNRTWEVYRLTCSVTGKSYVGKGNAKKRWVAHKRQAKSNHHYHLHDAIRQYGEASFTLDVLKTFTSEAEADAYEKFIIDSEDLTRRGYNEAPGMIVKVDLEQIRITRSLTTKDGWTDDRRLTLRKRYAGQGNPFFGHRHDRDTKEKISQTTKSNLNAHIKISQALKGHKVSQETRAKMSSSSMTRGRSLEEVFGLERAMILKERMRSNQPDRRGEKHPGAKLSEIDVINVVKRSIDKRTDKILALEYGVSERTVCKIRLGHSWKHLWTTKDKSDSTSS